MSKKRKSTTGVQKTGDGFIGRLFAQTKLPAHVTEEQDWYLDSPDVRLTRVFTIVLILHVVAVGGILAFKMVEKASTTAPIAFAEATDGTEATAPDSSVDTAEGTSGQASSTESPAPASRSADNDQAADSLLVDHPSATEYQEYRVGSGESLVSIARKLGVSASEIREINHLDSGGNLAVGRWIQVPKSKAAPKPAVAASKPPKPAPGPAAAAADPIPAPPIPAVTRTESPPRPRPTTPEPAPIAEAPAPAPAAPAPESSSNAPASYQVQKGDTLFGIARRFGIKHQDLMAANGIDRPENLQAGQTLKVPQP